MGRKALSRYLDKRTSASFKLNITSMVDMFVILLVFLLKSFSSSSVQVDPADGLRLPQSVSTKEPIEALKVIVSPTGIFVESVKVAEIKNGQVESVSTDKNDPQFIKPLFDELDKQAKKTKSIAEVNDTVEFEGKVLMQADKSIPYGLLKKVMYTSMMAGYADLKMAVISMK